MKAEKKIKKYNEVPPARRRTAQRELVKNQLRGSVDTKDKSGLHISGEALRLMKRAEGSRVPDDERAMMEGPAAAMAAELASISHWRKVEENAKAVLHNDSTTLVLNMSKPEALAKLNAISPQRNKSASPKKDGKYLLSNLMQL